MSNTRISLFDLRQKVAKFRDDRNWRQHHNPKSLAMSIMIEAAELAEHFQWETMAEAEAHQKDSKKKHQITQELADVVIYCLAFADAMNIELGEAIIAKLEHNQIKYPKDKAHDTDFIRQQRERSRRKQVNKRAR